MAESYPKHKIYICCYGLRGYQKMVGIVNFYIAILQRFFDMGSGCDSVKIHLISGDDMPKNLCRFDVNRL